MNVKHVPRIPVQLLLAIGKMLTIARKRRELRQIDLAERLGVSRQTVARMESGDPNTAAGTYFAAAWLLDVPIIQGMDSSPRKTQDALNNIINLFNEALPKRITTVKPSDDNSEF